MSWDRWRRVCGWLAVTSAVAWATKFALWAGVASSLPDGTELATATTTPVVGVLIGFLLPTIGSTTALVAGSGLAAPLVRNRPLWLGLVGAVVSAVVVTVVVGGLSDLFQTRVLDDLDSPLLTLEGTDLLAVALESGLALALLLPGRRHRSGLPSPQRRESVRS